MPYGCRSEDGDHDRHEREDERKLRLHDTLHSQRLGGPPTRRS
jgi:hypothetical protein